MKKTIYKSRNPFVNQVFGVIFRLYGHADQSVTRRNPFVNQVFGVVNMQKTNGTTNPRVAIPS